MYGRDILVRVMYGARVSMSVGVFAAILVLVIGALYGAISGYCGGKVDAVMQRIVELIYAVPEMLVVLLIATALKPILTDYVNSSGTSPMKSFVNVLGPNLISMFIAFGLLYWVTMSRIIRGQVLQLKQQEYVTAAICFRTVSDRSLLLPACRYRLQFSWNPSYPTLELVFLHLFQALDPWQQTHLAVCTLILTD